MKVTITVDMGDHVITRVDEAGGDDNPIYRAYVAENVISALGISVVEEIVAAHKDVRDGRRPDLPRQLREGRGR